LRAPHIVSTWHFASARLPDEGGFVVNRLLRRLRLRRPAPAVLESAVVRPLYVIELRRPDGSWQRDWRRGPWRRYQTAVRNAVNHYDGHIGLRVIDLTTGRVLAAESRWLPDSEYHRERRLAARFLRSVGALRW
jgi:hypothetical protein